MEEKNKTYTASDFARYHAGIMTNGDMYALERAALEDPFLANALEGYAHSTSPEKDIIELQEKLAEKHKQKKVISILSVAQSKWWRVAALFIIILGAGYLFYQINNKPIAQDSIAKNNIKTSPSKVESPSLVLKDSGVSNNDVAFENKEAAQLSPKSKGALPKTNTEIKPEKISNDEALNSREIAASSSPIKDSYSADTFDKSQSKTKSETSKQYVLKGIITDDIGIPIPSVTIEDKTKKYVTITDTSGQFFLLSPDSITKASAFAVGYVSKDILLKKDVLPIITMNRNQANLEEVAVTGYGRQQKKASPSVSKNSQGKVTGVESSQSSIAPFTVNKKFTEYINENTTAVYDANNMRLSGEVELSFSINKKGRPQHISVVKSTCRECEEQAIRLLENGPNWKERRNGEGTVLIKF